MEFLADQVQFINATAVPWVLRLVMLGLGLSLTLGDFKRVITFPKAAGIGLVAQLIGLPVTAFALAWLFDPAPTVAVGLVILAVCPSGVTSNAYTFAARGDVPLCVTLAAITSVITVFTIPFMISLALRTFMTAAEIELPVLGMLWDLAGLTLFPIAAGMLIRHKWSERAKQAEEPIRKMVLYLLYVVLAFGVITSWETIVAEFTTLGVMVLTMNLLTMGLGFGLGKLFKLPAPQIVTITYEVGVQNLALAFAITFNILQNPDLAVAALIYAAIMPVTALVFIRIARRMIESEAATQVAA
jgi:BASS family bile acid:Na+ symporter